MTVVGIFVENLLVTAFSTALVQIFFLYMGTLSIKDPGEVRKFLGMCIEH